MALDSEAHVLMECPLHGTAREDLIMSLSSPVFEAVGAAASAQDRLLAILRSSCASDWECIGRFLGRVRQCKRREKRRFEDMQKFLHTRGFGTCRAAWRTKGQFACRHGVLFRSPPLQPCHCLQQDFEHPIWARAAWMPMLDRQMRAIIAVPFDQQHFVRLGVLQAQLRQLGDRGL